MTIFGSCAYVLTAAMKRKRFGYVEQLFHEIGETLFDQTALHDEGVTKEEVEKALKLVKLQLNYARLMMPFNAGSFSRGQLQLLFIARGIVKDPETLLLDEITASLDAKTEQDVLQALEKVAKGRSLSL